MGIVKKKNNSFKNEVEDTIGEVYEPGVEELTNREIGRAGGVNGTEADDDSIIDKELKEQLEEKKKLIRKHEKEEEKRIKKEERKHKIKRFFSFYDFRTIIDEIRLLGYEISLNAMAFIFVSLVLLTCICSFLLRLKWQFLMILGIIMVSCMPYVVVMTFVSRYQERRFTNIVGYMEQMIYAFHKTEKIRSSLIDVDEVSTGDIKRCTKEMLRIIDYDDSTSKIYEKAFAVIQNRYNCSRLRVLHDYLIRVETNGGEYSQPLQILLEDLRAWVERVNSYQSERANVRSKSAISIVFALISCGIMVNLIPRTFSDQIVENNVYQVGTLVVIVLNILTYMFSCSQLAMSYLDKEVDSKNSYSVKRAAKFLSDWTKKDHVKTSIIKGLIMVPLVVAALYLDQHTIAAFVSCVILLVVTHDHTYKIRCQKKCTREIKKSFPIWLRSVVLLMQTDNVHVAIRNSYANCPWILKFELEKFMEELVDDPITIRPYKNFLGAYDVPDLKLAVHCLYSIAVFGAQDKMSQLNYLIAQNAKLEIVEEKIRNEDSVATFSMVILIPMLLAVVKLMIDLILFLNIFMGFMQSTGI